MNTRLSEINYFIQKFEAIDERFWITGDFRTWKGCCALGHCGMTNPMSVPEADRLVDLFGTYTTITKINDADDPQYSQPTPKQRILAALYDLKKAELVNNPPIDQALNEIVNQELINA